MLKKLYLDSYNGKILILFHI